MQVVLEDQLSLASRDMGKLYYLSFTNAVICLPTLSLLLFMTPYLLLSCTCLYYPILFIHIYLPHLNYLSFPIHIQLTCNPYTLPHLQPLLSCEQGHAAPRTASAQRVLCVGAPPVVHLCVGSWHYQLGTRHCFCVLLHLMYPIPSPHILFTTLHKNTTPRSTTQHAAPRSTRSI